MTTGDRQRLAAERADAVPGSSINVPLHPQPAADAEPPSERELVVIARAYALAVMALAVALGVVRLVSCAHWTAARAPAACAAGASRG